MIRLGPILMLSVSAAVHATPGFSMSDDARQRYFLWAEDRAVLEGKTAFEVMSDMLEALDGCVLPPAICKDLVSLAEDARNNDRFLASWNVLGTGMTSLHAAPECETKRSGNPVVGPALSTGSTDFVVMTVSSDLDADCFIRSFGTN